MILIGNMTIHHQLEALIFDFNGMLTDDRVWVDQEGREIVCCNRSDGLTFDVLRKLEIKMFILSTETNAVISSRGGKISIFIRKGKDVYFYHC